MHSRICLLGKYQKILDGISDGKFGKLQKVFTIERTPQKKWKNIAKNEIMEGILFEFEHKKLAVWAVEDDSVILRVQWTERKYGKKFRLINCSFQHPWKKILNESIIFFSILINNFGYHDGIQIHFSGLKRKPETIIQLLVAASSIHTYLLKRI